MKAEEEGKFRDRAKPVPASLMWISENALSPGGAIHDCISTLRKVIKHFSHAIIYNVIVTVAEESLCALLFSHGTNTHSQVMGIHHLFSLCLDLYRKYMIFFFYSI